MKRKSIAILALIMASLLVLCACAQPAASAPATEAPAPAPAEEAPAASEPAAEPEAPAPAAEEQKIVIGLSMASLQSSFFEGERFMAEKVAKDSGVEVITVIADGDPNKQKSQIEDLISKKVNAILCVPQDTVAIGSSVQQAKEAGIPFIAMGRMPQDQSNLTMGITCDNFVCADVDAAAIAAQAKNLGYETINAIELVGSLTDQNAAERSDGFKEFAAKNNINIVAQVATEWDADKCFSRLTDTVANLKPEDFNAMYVPSDFLLPTVMSVLGAAGRWVPAGEEGHVIIASIDGDPGAMESIREGYVYCTANTDAFDFGKLGMEWSIKIAKGETPPEQFVSIPTVALTKEDIESAGDTIWGNVY